MEDKYLMTLEQATEFTQLSEATLRRAIASGDLRAYRFGRPLRVTPGDLTRWIKQHEVLPSEPTRLLDRIDKAPATSYAKRVIEE